MQLAHRAQATPLRSIVVSRSRLPLAPPRRQGGHYAPLGGRVDERRSPRSTSVSGRAGLDFGVLLKADQGARSPPVRPNKPKQSKAVMRHSYNEFTAIGPTPDRLACSCSGSGCATIFSDGVDHIKRPRPGGKCTEIATPRAAVLARQGAQRPPPMGPHASTEEKSQRRRCRRARAVSPSPW